MSTNSIYNNGMYDELWSLAHELQPWFDIDKVKPYAVYVWTKGTEEPEYEFGENVFDICVDCIQFYTCTKPWSLPNDVMPIIKRIQEKLKEIQNFHTYLNKIPVR